MSSKVLVMNCIDLCVIYEYGVKQLMLLEHSELAASDLKNSTMVNCDIYKCLICTSAFLMTKMSLTLLFSSSYRLIV